MVVIGIMEMPRIAAAVITESNNSCFYLMPNHTYLHHYLAVPILRLQVQVCVSV